MGPLLFLIYINSITKVLIEGKLILFADDTVVVSSGRTWDEAFSKASSDLAKLLKWFSGNILTVNVSKTKYMPMFLKIDSDPGPRVLRMHSCGDPWSVSCGCGIVERVEQYKYLGIIIDRKLSWVPHIQHVNKRLRSLMHAFTQLSQVLTVDQCRGVYYAYAQSLLMYGVLAWGGASTNLLEPLGVTQRAIMKIILLKICSLNFRC